MLLLLLAKVKVFVNSEFLESHISALFEMIILLLEIFSFSINVKVLFRVKIRFNLDQISKSKIFILT